LFFFNKNTEHKIKVLSAMSYCRDIWEERAAWWLNPISAKTQQRIDSETHEKRAVRQENMSSQKNPACLKNHPTGESCQI